MGRGDQWEARGLLISYIEIKSQIVPAIVPRLTSFGKQAPPVPGWATVPQLPEGGMPGALRSPRPSGLPLHLLAIPAAPCSIPHVSRSGLPVPSTNGPTIPPRSFTACSSSSRRPGRRPARRRCAWWGVRGTWRCVPVVPTCRRFVPGAMVREACHYRQGRWCRACWVAYHDPVHSRRPGSLLAPERPGRPPRHQVCNPPRFDVLWE